MFVKFPLKPRVQVLGPGCRKPPRLDDNPLDAHQQRRRRRQSGADLSQDQAQGRDLLRRQGRLHGPAAGRAIQDARNGSRACRSSRRSSRSSRKRAASRSSAKSRARNWSAWPTTVPSTNCRPSITPVGFPAEIARIVEQAEVGPGQLGARRSIASSPGRTSAKPKARASSTSPPVAARKTFTLGKEQGLPPIAPLDDSGVFVPGFGGLSGKSAVDQALADWVLVNLQEKGRLFAVGKVSAQLPALLALQDGTAVPPRGRVVHQHGQWREARSWRRRASPRSTFLPEAINGKARELDWLQQHGRLDDLQETLLGPGPADLGR